MTQHLFSAITVDPLHLQDALPLDPADGSTFSGGNAAGYIDYPTLA